MSLEFVLLGPMQLIIKRVIRLQFSIVEHEQIDWYFHLVNWNPNQTANENGRSDISFPRDST